MDTKSLFLDSTGRIRSGWRFAVFMAIFLFLIYFLFAAVSTAVKLLGFWPDDTTPGLMVANAVLGLAAALLAGWICGRLLERIPFRALGASFTQGWYRNLVLGIVGGAATLSLAVLIAFAFGGLRFTQNLANSTMLVKSLAGALVVFASGAAFEEAVFRGYILQTFARSGLAWFGIVLTSAFFGIVHLQNPNADAISTINTLLAGVWFGLAYLKTRDLWFVWGLHLMWNWMQGAFFGIEVSGITDLVSTPLLKEIDSGPVWLTGETYGIEGGIVTTIAILVSIAVIYFLPGLNASEEVVEVGHEGQNGE